MEEDFIPVDFPNLSNEELFSKGTYQWVGGSPLGSYFVSATASHYDWAIKKLKAHKKSCSSRITMCQKKIQIDIQCNGDRFAAESEKNNCKVEVPIKYGILDS